MLPPELKIIFVLMIRFLADDPIIPWRRQGGISLQAFL